MNSPTAPSLQICALVGSLRADSLNRLVAAAAATLMPDGATLVEHPLRDVPLYDGDVEAAGMPDSVVALRNAVDTADGLVIFTPEYNRSIPAVTKNAVDWLSRMPGDSPLSRAAVGVVAATPGRHDAGGVRAHLSASVGANTDRLYEPTLGIASIGHRTENGRISDDDLTRELREWLAGFVNHVASDPAGG